MKNVIMYHKNALVNIICLALKLLSFECTYIPNLTHVNGIQLLVVQDRGLLSLKVW